MKDKVCLNGGDVIGKGSYGPKTGVYIDPWRPVRNALINNGHAGHSRWDTNTT
ncbi:hypothetical protein JMN32_02800 [Fulvivirga sp. 29W222]|uniref:Uncharacterized protein n=1 Tax=Fulvivirga marina TaxID=2494733 RepID=A0A937KCQ4_9BACT|nr:hypothetical protein [Fulvivirga marina]MBL6445220.1 hypothetical protein [Fulvivirga marina]